MITNFKIFENNINIGKPQVNDYVITEQYNLENVDPDNPKLTDWQKNYLDFIKFTDTHIGRIHFIDKYSTYGYIIKYKYVSDHLKGFFKNDCIQITQDEIKFWSKNKEDLNNEKIKQYSISKKYNI